MVKDAVDRNILFLEPFCLCIDSVIKLSTVQNKAPNYRIINNYNVCRAVGYLKRVLSFHI